MINCVNTARQYRTMSIQIRPLVFAKTPATYSTKARRLCSSFLSFLAGLEAALERLAKGEQHGTIALERRFAKPFHIFSSWLS